MFEKVVNVLKDFTDIGAADIAMESELITDLELNSLDIINIVAAFEEEFDITVSDRAISGFRKVSDIVAYLEKAIA